MVQSWIPISAGSPLILNSTIQPSFVHLHLAGGPWPANKNGKNKTHQQKNTRLVMKKTEELCPFYLFVFFWDSFVRMMEKFLLISCLPTGIWRTQAQAFFAASHLSHEFTSVQMRLKWVEQEFASVPCGKIQWKVVVFFLWASRLVVITNWFCCLSVGLLIAVLKKTWGNGFQVWLCTVHGFVPEKGVVVLDMSQSSLVMQHLTYTLLAECDVEMISINHDDICIYI